MVVLLDFDEDVITSNTETNVVTRGAAASATEDIGNNSNFAASLACYPYAFIYTLYMRRRELIR